MPFPRHRTVVWLEDSHHRAHRGRLAGAVAADQSDDLSLIDG